MIWVAIFANMGVIPSFNVFKTGNQLWKFSLKRMPDLAVDRTIRFVSKPSI